MNRQIAHNIENKLRTEDVKTVENVDFTAMLLSDVVLKGLLANGFKKPSPIQLKAIPMGRCGYDLILQAKSGTGKTAVFGIIALEMIDVSKNEVQVLMIAPTREIAVQIKDVIESIGMNFKGLKVEYFIGGMNINEDIQKLKNCHIAVGAPGRIKHLVKDGHLNLDCVKLFVLDEADKIIATDQQKDINFIYNKLPRTKQIIASSATYPGDLKKFLSKYMLTPTVVNSQSDVPTLLGIRQFVTTVPNHLNVVQQMNLKNAELIRILQSVSFNQCIVFCNYQTRAETLSNNLSREGWPTTSISAAQNQKSRLEAVSSLKDFKCRILCTTDLTARGIDAANVDLVINYEVPIDCETYLHRMGRAGRYGSSGLCISIVSDTEVEKFQKLLGKVCTNLSVMIFPKENVPQDIWTCQNFDTLNAIVDSKTDQICDNMKELSVNQNNKNYEINIQSVENSNEINENQINNINVATCSNEKGQITKENCILNSATDCEEKIVNTDNSPEINVEEMLSSLNKQEEVTKNKLKQKFKHVDTSTLLNLLTTDTCKEKVIENTDNSSEINVENMLTSLNKQEEVTKNELKEKFKHIDFSTILNLLTSDTDTCKENVENTTNSSEINVEEMLSSVNKQEEITKNELKHKFKHIDTSTLLNLLTTDKLEDNSTSEDSDTKLKSKCKKARRDKKTKLDTDKENNEKFENEALLFQKNSLVYKNTALYNLTKIVVEHDSITEDTVTSAEELLKIMEQEDKIELQQQKSKLNFNDLLDNLGLSDNAPVIGKWEVVNKEPETTQVICTCPNNLFNKVFDFAISKNENHWLDSICEIHKNIEPDTIVQEEEEQEENMDCEYYDDEYIDYEDYEEENYEENNSEMEEQESFIYDDDVFVKAYDYALKSQVRQIEQSPESNVENTCGYAASYNYEHLKSPKRKRVQQKSKTSDKRKETNSDTTYESYYEYYNTMLEQNGPYFTDVQEFEEWFSKWQTSVSDVRNYVQDEIYQHLKRTKESQ